MESLFLLKECTRNRSILEKTSPLDPMVSLNENGITKCLLNRCKIRPFREERNNLNSIIINQKKMYTNLKSRKTSKESCFVSV